MKPNLLKILTFSLLFIYLHGSSQEIWRESFSIPNKGVWGDEDGTTIHTDFSNISKWQLDYTSISLNGPDDYAKTVTTSGGRFECKDTNGEITWRSEIISISDYRNVSIELIASETGSGANENTKYLKACYILDNNDEREFESNGSNLGDWGSGIATQTGINGETIQIIVYLNNHYSADKVIADEVVVRGEEINPVEINPGDLVINEVLFNPVPDGNDYVELFNQTDQSIPLNKLYLASRDNNLELTQIYPLTSKRIEFQAQSYLALTKDTLGIFPWFTIKCPKCFLQMEKFPSYNNDEDYVVLLNNDLEVIDELFYNEKMHMPLISDREGVALERISFTAETNDKSNWYSASTEAGYGTPGYKNSQFENENLQRVSVTFEPESFSPNNDGYNDIYSIQFNLDKPGYIANIWIYDSSGRRILQLCKNNILGTNDKITWNGENESGQRQKLGVYVVLVEIFNTDGFVKQFKDGVVLTDVLN